MADFLNKNKKNSNSKKTNTKGKKTPKKKKKKRKSWLREWTETILVAGFFYIFISQILIQAHQIPSSSMENTLLIGDILFSNKIIYGPRIPFTNFYLPPFREPERGDVIIFTPPEDRTKDYVKRVIGIPGDTVQVINNNVIRNGEKIDEPYVKIIPPRSPLADSPKIVVPEGKLFALGDNRNHSSDSRAWGFVDRKDIKGKVGFIYWSWDPDKKMPRFSRIFRFVK